MKKIALILIGTLAGGATTWAYGPYCGPVPRLPPPVYVHSAPVVRVGYCAPPVVYSTRVLYSTPVVVTPAPVVYQAPVVYTPPPAVYVAPVLPPLPPPPVIYQAPVVYSAPAPVVYARPAYYAPPEMQFVAALPLFPFWYGGGHHSSWSHRGGHRR
jgi:hypothetical protein